MTLSLEVIRAVDDPSLPSDAEFENWANLAADGKADRAELCIRIVDEDESQELNRDYRDKDKPTNVLSFPFDAPPGLPVNILGDLAICASVVEQEAKEQNKAAKDHWAHMVIHGVLHLRGFDHIKDEDAEEMEALEVKLLASIGISDPYSQ